MGVFEPQNGFLRVLLVVDLVWFKSTPGVGRWVKVGKFGGKRLGIW